MKRVRWNCRRQIIVFCTGIREGIVYGIVERILVWALEFEKGVGDVGIKELLERGIKQEFGGKITEEDYERLKRLEGSITEKGDRE